MDKPSPLLFDPASARFGAQCIVAEEEKMITEDELKRGEEELQKYADRFIHEVNAVAERKEKEIMEV